MPPIDSASQSSRASRLGPQAVGGVFAALAAVVGLAYAAISAYWGAGGTWLLSTVDASLSTNHNASALVAVWGAVVLKIAAAVIPLLVFGNAAASRWQRGLMILAWIEAVILTLYGLVLTVTEMFVLAGVVAAPKTADRHALAWHAYLWDPWFLLWGLLVAMALCRTKRSYWSRREKACPAPREPSGPRTAPD